MSKARLLIEHPSEGSGGTAIEVKMFYQTDGAPGFVRISFAGRTAGGFDFENAIQCDLDFGSVSEIVHVADGGCNPETPVKIGDSTFFAFRREEDGSLLMAAMRKIGDIESKSQILLSPHEATGIRCALQQALFFMSFIKGVNA